MVRAARLALLAVLASGAFATDGLARAADYRAIAESVTILYDAPSTKAKPLFLLGRDTPVEVIVALEGWTKIRDATGTIGWVEKKSLADKHSLLIRIPLADVRAAPEDTAAVVFRAEKDVLLELAEPAASPTATSTPGWVKVKHRDGQAGYVRVVQVFGF